MKEFLNGNFLFYVNFFISNIPIYNITYLPGFKRGISGSTIGGYNIGINIYSDNKKKDTAIEALKYATSKSLQKKFVKKNGIYSGIKEIYEEEDVCNIVNCHFFKNIQPIGRPSHVNDYDKYSENFLRYINDFFYKNETALETLKKIENITKIHYISFMLNDTYIGFIYTIMIIGFIIFMLFSLIFLFIEKFKYYYTFLPEDFWILTIIGIIIILSTIYIETGKRNLKKCYLNLIFLFHGFSLTKIPIFYKLICNFPEENKIREWISEHKYIFLFIFIFIDITLLILLIIPSYKIKKIEISDGENFEICNIENKISISIIAINLLIKILILLAILILIYIEWNREDSYYDIRFIVSAIYTDFLIIIISFIIFFLNIENYKISYILYSSLCLLYSLCNYICIYGIRIMLAIMKKDNDRSLFIKKVNQYFINSSIKNSKTYNTESDNIRLNLKTKNEKKSNNSSKSSSKNINTKSQCENSNNACNNCSNEIIPSVNSGSNNRKMSTISNLLVLKLSDYHSSKFPVFKNNSISSNSNDSSYINYKYIRKYIVISLSSLIS